MKFSTKDFFSKCDQIRSPFPADLVTFTEEILNGKLHFLCSALLHLWFLTHFMKKFNSFHFITRMLTQNFYLHLLVNLFPISLLYPWKQQKTLGFLFSGDIKVEHWLKWVCFIWLISWIWSRSRQSLKKRI